MLRDKRLQFELSDYHPPKPPGWLKPLGEFLDAIMPALNLLFWAGAAVLAGLIIWFIVREVAQSRVGQKKPKMAPAESAWRIDAQKARILLADADQLAAEGRFAEAAHLLLLKGVEDVQDRRPREVKPALTSREIAALPQLPEAARVAFRAIAEVVERSLFGGRDVDEAAWSDCRQSYEALIIAAVWR